MLTYALGECANSLVMNGIFGFAMLFYTKALGLDPMWAGIAMSISVFWEAISEPVMGHISDKTRSRWGRRHPYMIFGGLLMALCSYMIWLVPESFRVSQLSTFWYLVTINLFLRTGLTMFFIPFMALGFEICTDYQGRSRLQGLRQIFNMAANFAGPAMAWSIFFQDHNGIRATTVPANYLRMGGVFAIATALVVVIVVASTFHWHEDTRYAPRTVSGAWLGDFLKNMKELILDPNPRWVFVFIFLACAGMVVVSSLQMFVYDDFMKFSGYEKSIAHGGTMLGMALGALVSIGLARRYDKKGAVLVGGVISILSNGVLALLFLTGLILPDTASAVRGRAIPMGLGLFTAFHGLYWLGNGIMLPISTAMIGDVAEIHLLQTGVNKDGGYSSLFSLAMRIAISFSLVVSGFCLDLIGYKVPRGSETVTQSPEAIWRLGFVTFVVGAIICLAALLAIRLYPITRIRLEQVRAASKVKSEANVF
jgi:GPH family glycoside/pentoside/hexuronide:cation symporter